MQWQSLPGPMPDQALSHDATFSIRHPESSSTALRLLTARGSGDCASLQVSIIRWEVAARRTTGLRLACIPGHRVTRGGRGYPQRGPQIAASRHRQFTIDVL